jgi:hypothetical protein
MNDTTNIFDVFRATGKHLRDDQILGSDDRNQYSLDVDRHGPGLKVHRG